MQSPFLFQNYVNLKSFTEPWGLSYEMFSKSRYEGFPQHPKVFRFKHKLSMLLACELVVIATKSHLTEHLHLKALFLIWEIPNRFQSTHGSSFLFQFPLKAFSLKVNIQIDEYDYLFMEHQFKSLRDVSSPIDIKWAWFRETRNPSSPEKGFILHHLMICFAASSSII